ncbi:MAG: hypothetical protein ABSA41_13445 [Terriglobia bacterium]|jgi:hypothetical protein
MKLAAFPKWFMDELVRDRSMSLFERIETAAARPIDGLELYDAFLTSFDEASLEKVCGALAPCLNPGCLTCGTTR